MLSPKPLSPISTQADLLMLSELESGDENALKKLYARNKSRIAALVRDEGGYAADGEDLLQEASITLWQNVRKPGFSLSGSLDGYLLAIARNLWRNMKRKNNRISFPGDNLGVGIANNLDTSLAPESAHLLSVYMDKLGPLCKSLLTLFYFHGMDMGEVAAQLGLANANTAKSKKYQCKTQLARLLKTQLSAEDLL